MHESDPDPYCHPGTSVLKNRLDLREQAQLDDFEKFIIAQRSDEPLPGGRPGYAHYCAIHRHLFQDVFAWAGKLRTVRMQNVTACFATRNTSMLRCESYSTG